jgi:hypothetical protein
MEEEEAWTPKQPWPPWPHEPLNDDEHWTLSKEIKPSKFQHLLHLPHTLSVLNYVTWLTMMESNLETVDLFDYCTGSVLKPSTSEKRCYNYWWCTNALVWSILTMNMTEEAICQLGHFPEALMIWKEVRHLFAGQTLMDWTLIITGMVTTRYNNGDDLPAHIAWMKAYHCDLILMQCDIDDQIFACFLRISMPSTWNYVFAGLPNYYTSAEVEQWIKDEYGVSQNQNSAALAYKATTSSNLKQKSHTAQTARSWATMIRTAGQKGVEQQARDWNRGNNRKRKIKRGEEMTEETEIEIEMEGGDTAAKTVKACDGHHLQNIIMLTEPRGMRPIMILQAMTHLHQVHLLTWQIQHYGYQWPAGSWTAGWLLTYARYIPHSPHSLQIRWQLVESIKMDPN